MATYKRPAEAEVREVVRRITTPQLRRAFFEGLENPFWVAPLAELGFFSSPPEPESMPDGTIRDIYWPEMEYLVRVAPEVPSDVVDVILPLGTSSNAWVRRGVVAIGGALPDMELIRLAPLLRSWAETGFGWRTDPQELVKLSVRLLQSDSKKLGRWFANVLFRPKAVGSRRRPTEELEGYWYEQSLPELVAALDGTGLTLVWPWLELYERQVGHLSDAFDMTYFGRGSIGVRGDSHDGVEQALIDAARDLAVQAVLLDPRQAISVLLRPPTILGRKIALYSLAIGLRQPSSDPASLEPMAIVGEGLLSDRDFLEDECRIEYAELSRSMAVVRPEFTGRLPEVLAVAPVVDEDRLRAWLAQGEDLESDDALDERVADYRARWRHRWLSSIGVEALPAQMRRELESLDGRFGVMDAPLQPASRISSWVGPSSPMTVEEMSVMSSTELVAHLESWHSTARRAGAEPSHEGQGRELTTLLTSNPMALTGVSNLTDRLRPTYLRAILGGWEAAIKAGLSPDWDNAAHLICEILAHGYESAVPREGDDFDDDGDFGGAKHAAIGLLEELVKTGGAVKIPDAAMARFADLLIASGDDDRAWIAYSSGAREGGMDPLTLSLNLQWPMRVRGLARLMTRGRGTPWYDRARIALERELERDDVRGASRAVVGEVFGRLWNVDAEWAEQNVASWFGTADGTTTDQQIALTTAISLHHYHPMLCSLLSGPMMALLSADQPIAVGWTTPQSGPIQRIGEWVIEAIIRGDRDVRDPLANAFLSTAAAKERGEAIGHIAWTFMHAEHVDDAIRDRFADFWDERVEHVRSAPDDVEELSGFLWFIKCGKFNAEWWLPRLRQVLALSPDLGEQRYMIGKELASAADIDPRATFEALRLLLSRREEAGLTAFDLSRNALPMVLARAIHSNDEVLRSEATRYMNMLGEQGHLTLQAEVNDVIEGGISQADVAE